MSHLNFIHKRPLVTISLLFVLGAGAIFGNMVYLTQSINKELALKYADSYLVALNTFHSFYSSDVVARVKGTDVIASSRYKEHEASIPVPATLSIELANRISALESGVSTRLYSDFPFATRLNGGPRDPFESLALSNLRFSEDQALPFYGYEMIAGQQTLRYAKSLVMAESCVACHNSHPDSTKTDWKVGDVRGARVVNISLNGVHKIAQGGWLMTLFVLGAIVTISVLLIFVIIRALRTSVRMLSLTNTAYNRFVPHEFLSYLNKQSIIEVQLNDNIEKQMTILFSDIRSFTSISEGMTPQENFQFINDYLGIMGPIIRHNNGFIDKYIGDAIMALFDNTDDALQASLQMIATLKDYNIQNADHLPHELEVGIGVHQGKVRLGAIGEDGRMDGTVISDAVNLASRIESSTKLFGSQFLISEYALRNIENSSQVQSRLIGEVQVKGKLKSVTLYEIFSGEASDVIGYKKATLNLFEDAVLLYQAGSFDEALAKFNLCLDQSPNDTAAIYYQNLCLSKIA